ncbi:hypothetical protein HGA88_01860 [Candidatus Roizmanbacteria bacterium]|nr:hypothetical protein [Candidatus Roizmanbacteria bacterium]
MEKGNRIRTINFRSKEVEEIKDIPWGEYKHIIPNSTGTYMLLYNEKKFSYFDLSNLKEVFHYDYKWDGWDQLKEVMVDDHDPFIIVKKERWLDYVYTVVNLRTKEEKYVNLKSLKAFKDEKQIDWFLLSSDGNYLLFDSWRQINAYKTLNPKEIDPHIQTRMQFFMVR